MPAGHYGWVQTRGNAFLKVIDDVKPAFIDFMPNHAKLQLSEESLKDSQNPPKELSHDLMNENSSARHKNMRFSQLPPLLIEAGPYCDLLREARDVFVDGYFYACVAMCGISLERFQRDKAKLYGAKKTHKARTVRNMLKENNAISPETLTLCNKMADLRNNYAHGNGLKPQEDALKALEWIRSFIDEETNLMRDYLIVNGVLNRRKDSS